MKQKSQKIQIKKNQQTKALLLISGGIDSPVAGYLMKQKGLDVIALHFSVEPFSDNTPELKSKALAKKIGITRFITVTNGTQQAALTKLCEHRFYYILQRRLFLRIAEKIAEMEQCKYLITGDNLGQVGSQTLKNMEVITSAVKIPILRPILTNDKVETMAKAREIGTYELSIGPEICSILGPKNPATSSTLDKIEYEESKINVDELVRESLKTVRIEEI